MDNRVVSKWKDSSEPNMGSKRKDSSSRKARRSRSSSSVKSNGQERSPSRRRSTSSRREQRARRSRSRASRASQASQTGSSMEESSVGGDGNEPMFDEAEAFVPYEDVKKLLAIINSGGGCNCRCPHRGGVGGGGASTSGNGQQQQQISTRTTASEFEKKNIRDNLAIKKKPYKKMTTGKGSEFMEDTLKLVRDKDEYWTGRSDRSVPCDSTCFLTKAIEVIAIAGITLLILRIVRSGS